MKLFYIIILCLIVFALLLGHYDLLIILILLTAVVIFITKLKKIWKLLKENLSATYKEFEGAKTNNPADLLQEQLKFYSERISEEVFGKEAPKKVDPIEGISKGSSEIIKASKKLFKK